MGMLFKSCMFIATLLSFANIYSMQECKDDDDIEISIRIKRGSLLIERQINGNDKKLTITSGKSICPEDHARLLSQINTADQIARELLCDHEPEKLLGDCLQKKTTLEEKGKCKSQPGDHTDSPKSHKPPHKDTSGSSWGNPIGYTVAISLGAITLVALHWLKWFKKG